jgi:hypothetical protein
MADDDAQRERKTRHAGRDILVTATRAPSGRWIWSYLIDGRLHSVGRVPCASAEAALLQGLNAAKAKADGV